MVGRCEVVQECTAAGWREEVIEDDDVGGVGAAAAFFGGDDAGIERYVQDALRLVCPVLKMWWMG